MCWKYNTDKSTEDLRFGLMKTPTIAPSVFGEHIYIYVRLMWTSGEQMTYFMKLFRRTGERHRSLMLSQAQVLSPYPIWWSSSRRLPSLRSLSSWSRHTYTPSPSIVYVVYYAIAGTRQTNLFSTAKFMRMFDEKRKARLREIASSRCDVMWDANAPVFTGRTSTLLDANW